MAQRGHRGNDSKNRSRPDIPACDARADLLYVRECCGDAGPPPLYSHKQRQKSPEKRVYTKKRDKRTCNGQCLASRNHEEHDSPGSCESYENPRMEDRSKVKNCRACEFEDQQEQMEGGENEFTTEGCMSEGTAAAAGRCLESTTTYETDFAPLYEPTECEQEPTCCMHKGHNERCVRGSYAEEWLQNELQIEIDHSRCSYKGRNHQERAAAGNGKSRNDEDNTPRQSRYEIALTKEEKGCGDANVCPGMRTSGGQHTIVPSFSDVSNAPMDDLKSQYAPSRKHTLEYTSAQGAKTKQRVAQSAATESDKHTSEHRVTCASCKSKQNSSECVPENAKPEQLAPSPITNDYGGSTYVAVEELIMSFRQQYEKYKHDKEKDSANPAAEDPPKTNAMVENNNELENQEQDVSNVKEAKLQNVTDSAKENPSLTFTITSNDTSEKLCEKQQEKCAGKKEQGRDAEVSAARSNSDCGLMEPTSDSNSLLDYEMFQRKATESDTRFSGETRRLPMSEPSTINSVLSIKYEMDPIAFPKPILPGSYKPRYPIADFTEGQEIKLESGAEFGSVSSLESPPEDLSNIGEREGDELQESLLQLFYNLRSRKKEKEAKSKAKREKKEQKEAKKKQKKEKAKAKAKAKKEEAQPEAQLEVETDEEQEPQQEQEEREQKQKEKHHYRKQEEQPRSSADGSEDKCEKLSLRMFYDNSSKFQAQCDVSQKEFEFSECQAVESLSIPSITDATYNVESAATRFNESSRTYTLEKCSEKFQVAAKEEDGNRTPRNQASASSVLSTDINSWHRSTNAEESMVTAEQYPWGSSDQRPGTKGKKNNSEEQRWEFYDHRQPVRMSGENECWDGFSETAQSPIVEYSDTSMGIEDESSCYNQRQRRRTATESMATTIETNGRRQKKQSIALYNDPPYPSFVTPSDANFIQNYVGHISSQAQLITVENTETVMAANFEQNDAYTVEMSDNDDVPCTSKQLREQIKYDELNAQRSLKSSANAIEPGQPRQQAGQQLALPERLIAGRVQEERKHDSCFHQAKQLHNNKEHGKEVVASTCRSGGINTDIHDVPLPAGMTCSNIDLNNVSNDEIDKFMVEAKRKTLQLCEKFDRKTALAKIAEKPQQNRAKAAKPNKKKARVLCGKCQQQSSTDIDNENENEMLTTSQTTTYATDCSHATYLCESQAKLKNSSESNNKMRAVEKFSNATYNLDSRTTDNDCGNKKSKKKRNDNETGKAKKENGKLTGNDKGNGDSYLIGNGDANIIDNNIAIANATNNVKDIGGRDFSGNGSDYDIGLTYDYGNDTFKVIENPKLTRNDKRSQQKNDNGSGKVNGNGKRTGSGNDERGDQHDRGNGKHNNVTNKANKQRHGENKNRMDSDKHTDDDCRMHSENDRDACHVQNKFHCSCKSNDHIVQGLKANGNANGNAVKIDHEVESGNGYDEYSGNVKGQIEKHNKFRGNYDADDCSNDTSNGRNYVRNKKYKYVMKRGDEDYAYEETYNDRRNYNDSSDESSSADDNNARYYQYKGHYENNGSGDSADNNSDTRTISHSLVQTHTDSWNTDASVTDTELYGTGEQTNAYGYTSQISETSSRCMEADCRQRKRTQHIGDGCDMKRLQMEEQRANKEMTPNKLPLCQVAVSRKPHQAREAKYLRQQQQVQPAYAAVDNVNKQRKRPQHNKAAATATLQTQLDYQKMQMQLDEAAQDDHQRMGSGMCQCRAHRKLWHGEAAAAAVGNRRNANANARHGRNGNATDGSSWSEYSQQESGERRYYANEEYSEFPSNETSRTRHITWQESSCDKIGAVPRMRHKGRHYCAHECCAAYYNVPYGEYREETSAPYPLSNCQYEIHDLRRLKKEYEKYLPDIERQQRVLELQAANNNAKQNATEMLQKRILQRAAPMQSCSNQTLTGPAGQVGMREKKRPAVPAGANIATQTSATAFPRSNAKECETQTQTNSQSSFNFQQFCLSKKVSENIEELRETLRASFDERLKKGSGSNTSTTVEATRSAFQDTREKIVDQITSEMNASIKNKNKEETKVKGEEVYVPIVGVPDPYVAKVTLSEAIQIKVIDPVIMEVQRKCRENMQQEAELMRELMDFPQETSETCKKLFARKKQ